MDKKFIDRIINSQLDYLQTAEFLGEFIVSDNSEVITSFTGENGIVYSADNVTAMREKVSSESVDLIFADPPFNLSKNYKSNINDDLSDEDYILWTKRWIDECIRVLKPGGSLYIYNTPKWNSFISNYLMDKLDFRHWIAINFKGSLPVKGKLYPSHYSLLYFTKGKANTFTPPRVKIEICRKCAHDIKDYGGHKKKLNPLGINISDVWNDISPVRHKKNRSANELSLKLLDRILDISSKEGDLMLDPFAGSGTTLAASELKGRRYIGIELDDCSDIISRLENLDDDRSHLKKIEENKNCLFSEKDLRKRNRLKIDNSKYNLKKAA